ncbi:MAG: uridine monophosphate kinase [Candidatus Nomurabacteria bacterium]|jgi:uridylate kinase|nr:uridine monophosphate kinase [Candidatus Nomurabacteria bacterium]
MKKSQIRLLLKLSGEQLAGDSPRGFDIERAKWIVGEVKKAQAAGAEVVITVGAGNLVRGKYFAGPNIRQVTADNMGMVAIIINALALADVFNSLSVPAAALSNIKADQVIDQYTYRRALNHLAKGRVVIVGGGTGRPYVTSDSAAVSLALELDCDLVLKATKVDGVFDDDPETNPTAQKIPHLSLSEAVENPKVKVMDKAALGLAADFHKPIVVFELLKAGNIARIAAGKTVGTRIE